MHYLFAMCISICVGMIIVGVAFGFIFEIFQHIRLIIKGKKEETDLRLSIAGAFFGMVIGILAGYLFAETQLKVYDSVSTVETYQLLKEVSEDGDIIYNENYYKDGDDMRLVPHSTDVVYDAEDEPYYEVVEYHGLVYWDGAILHLPKE